MKYFYSRTLTESTDSTIYGGIKFKYGNQLELKKWNEDLHRQFPDLLESEVTLCSKNCKIFFT